MAVLRQCDEPAVRELAVQCVMQAVAAHPRGLGSGWRMATQALRLGAADGAPAVMAQAQEALQVRGRGRGRRRPVITQSGTAGAQLGRWGLQASRDITKQS